MYDVTKSNNMNRGESESRAGLWEMKSKICGIEGIHSFFSFLIREGLDRFGAQSRVRSEPRGLGWGDRRTERLWDERESRNKIKGLGRNLRFRLSLSLSLGINKYLTSTPPFLFLLRVKMKRTTISTRQPYLSIHI